MRKKKLIKICAMAICLASLGASVSYATESDARNLINKIYDNMDQMDILTGNTPTPRERLEVPNGGETTTTTTESVVHGKNEEKAEEKDYVKNLRESLRKNDVIVKALEEILNKYPKTIRGKEEKLVKLLVKSDKLRKDAAELLKILTGEEVTISKVSIPEKYQDLLKK